MAERNLGEDTGSKDANIENEAEKLDGTKSKDLSLSSDEKKFYLQETGDANIVNVEEKSAELEPILTVLGQMGIREGVPIPEKNIEQEKKVGDKTFEIETDRQKKNLAVPTDSVLGDTFRAETTEIVVHTWNFCEPGTESSPCLDREIRIDHRSGRPEIDWWRMTPQQTFRTIQVEQLGDGGTDARLQTEQVRGSGAGASTQYRYPPRETRFDGGNWVDHRSGYPDSDLRRMTPQQPNRTVQFMGSGAGAKTQDRYPPSETRFDGGNWVDHRAGYPDSDLRRMTPQHPNRTIQYEQVGTAERDRVMGVKILTTVDNLFFKDGQIY